MQNHHRFTSILIVTLLLMLGIETNAQSSLKDEMRLPWATATGNFVRDWLVIGGFPNQEGKGYDTDLLQEHQGETNIKPTEGMAHRLPNGSSLVWKKYHSPYNYVNFFNALKDLDYNLKVAYAYTTIERSAAGKVIISFGNNVSNKIWINGNLVYESKNDYSTAENNQIEVDMNKGENSVLIKSIHGGWTWGFVFRLIETDKFSLVHDFQLSPSIIKSGSDEKLIIKTDRTLNPEIQKIDVNVKAVAAGGKITAEKNVKRGDQITFDTKNWTNGVYDICFKSINNKGEVVTAYLYWYKGNAIEAAKKLILEVPKDPQSPDELVHVMLSELIRDRLGDELERADSTNIWNLYSPLMEYEELKLQRAGKIGNVRPNGFVRLAYKDDIDNTPQFCRAYLPLEYDPNKKWPLVVNLHGYNGANPVYVKWWSIDQRHTSIVDKYPVINIEPHGRGNTSYNGIGERDVLRTIELAKQLFNIDEDMIYLKGESMGGGGTWNVGTRNPELFAAIAPVYGGWDYHVALSEEQLAKLSDRDRFNYERNSSFSQADALLTTPVFVFHGDIDVAVDVKNSRYGVQLLQRWGYDIRYHEMPGFGHEGIPYQDQLIPWFLKHKRNANPNIVRVRSANLRSASAHWVNVTQRNDPYSFIEAEAEVLINNTIRLSTDNVLEIELSPSNKLINHNKPVTVVWNVNDIRKVNVTNGKIILQSKDYKPSQLTKNPKIEGPMTELTTTPFALVIGTTSKDTLMKRMINQKAMDFVREWKNWQKYEPRVFKDTELSESDMKNYSLILYGGPTENLISKKLEKNIPLRITSNEIEISGKKFSANDAYVQMIYPHPLNNERYVSVIGATSGAGMFFYNGFTNDCDFIIQDGTIGHLNDRIFIARGLFNYNWQITDELLERGNEELRKVSPVRILLPDLTTTIKNLPIVDMKIYESFVGKYEIQQGMNVTVYLDENRLMIIGPDGFKSEMYPKTEYEYFIPEANMRFTFGKDENGKVDKLIVHQQNGDFSIKKIE